MENKENPLDPFDAAKREGRVFGLGLKGVYRKNKVTFFGFLLLGLSFLGVGLAGAFGIILSFFWSSHELGNFIGQYIALLIFAGMIYIGVLMIIKVISK